MSHYPTPAVANQAAAGVGWSRWREFRQKAGSADVAVQRVVMVV